jgi:hypothetical protein
MRIDRILHLQAQVALFLDPEDECNKTLRNFGNYLPVDTV